MLLTTSSEASPKSPLRMIPSWSATPWCGGSPPTRHRAGIVLTLASPSIEYIPTTSKQLPIDLPTHLTSLDSIEVLGAAVKQVSVVVPIPKRKAHHNLLTAFSRIIQCIVQGPQPAIILRRPLSFHSHKTLAHVIKSTSAVGNLRPPELEPRQVCKARI